MKLLNYYGVITSLGTIAIFANTLNVVKQINIEQTTNEIIKIFETLNWKFATRIFANITIENWKNNHKQTFFDKTNDLFIEAITSTKKSVAEAKKLITNVNIHIRYEDEMFGRDFITFNLYKNFRTQRCYGVFVIYNFAK